MTPPIATTEPALIIAGDTVTWRRSFADYPATDGWTLKYAFRGAGSIDATASADGADYVVTINSTASLVLPGVYEWVAYVEKGTAPVERHSLASGRVPIGVSLAGVTNTSRQAHAERALALCETQIETLLASSIESQTIEQTAIQHRKLDELYSIRNRYRTELQRLRNGGRLPAIEISFARR